MQTTSTDQLIPQQEESIEKAVWVEADQLEEQLNNTYESLKGIINSI
jgi:hypothetical protein